MTKILVFGGSGLVGSKFIEQGKEFTFESPSLDEVDLLDSDQISQAIANFNGEVVINFAAFTNVDGAEEENGNRDGLVYRLNSLAPKNIAKFCKQNKKYFLQISTDYVFDGKKDDSPYTEEDRPNPINWYGKTKFFGEEFVIEEGGEFLIARLSMPFSSHYIEKSDIARSFLKLLQSGNEIRAIADQKITPVLVDDLASALTILIKEKETGIFHLVSSDSTTPYEFAKNIAKIFSLNENLVKTTTFADYSTSVSAPRLKNSWLSSQKFNKKFGEDILHSVKGALEIFRNQIESADY
jgi:dTDP-4-dehydrorhamnose reductase